MAAVIASPVSAFTVSTPGQSVSVPASSVTGPSQVITVTYAQAVAALTAAGYTVTAPGAALGPVTPFAPAIVAPTLLVVCAQNGATNPTWDQDYSWQATDARADKTDGGYGNPACIKVTVTGAFGGFQPSNDNDNGKVTDFSKCTQITAAISAAKGTPFAIYFLMGGDTAINAPGYNFTKAVDGWEVVTFPKALAMTDATKGDVSASIYKGAIQLKTGGTGTFLVDNWGGI